MPNIANDPTRKSWINVPENCDFPIQNIPFGVFITKENVNKYLESLKKIKD